MNCDKMEFEFVMKMKNKIKFDNILCFISILYVILPILIFLYGWTRIWFFIIGFVFFSIFTYSLYINFTNENDTILLKKENLKFFVIAILIVLFWIYFSGIGSYSYQHIDFRARNPMFYDLCNMDWPIYYDISNRLINVHDIVASNEVALSYYFMWWLVPSSIVKMLNLNMEMANFLLYIHSFVGIFLSIFLICKILKNCKIKYILIFIFFGGLDIICYLILNQSLPKWYWFKNIEGCFGRWLEFHSNTNQLYTVFNQVIPVWIILSMMLLLKNKKLVLGLCSLVFIYSPWVMLWLLPIMFYIVFIKDNDSFIKNVLKNIINIMSFENIVIPIFILIVFGSFYSANSKGDLEIGLNMFKYKSIYDYFIKYILFILSKFLIYIFVMRKDIKQMPYFYVMLFELIVIPLFYIKDRNFFMRGSIPALFILMVMIMKYFEINNDLIKINKKILSVLLVISSTVALSQIGFSIYRKFTSKNYLNTSLISFNKLDNIDDELFKVVVNNFFVNDYEEKFFYKYIVKNS